MKTLKIDRNKWSRGKTINTSINEAGFPRTWLWDKQVNAGCCLGHYCIQLAEFNIDLLDTYGEPRELADIHGENIEGLTLQDEDGYGAKHTEFSDEAMDINDDQDITNEQREASLITLFAKNDIELSFYN